MRFTGYDTRVAAYAVIVDERGRLLLTWFNGGGTPSRACWSLPGGGVEYDESLPAAVAREVREEAGCVVEVGRPLVTHSFTQPGWTRNRPYKAVLVLFEARIVGGEHGTTEVGGSTDLARWVLLPDVPALEPRADVIDVAVAAHR